MPFNFDSLKWSISKIKLKSNGDKASPFLKPFVIGNLSDKRLPTRTLLLVLFRHFFLLAVQFS